MNECEDAWPIMIRCKPAPPTMATWARKVDEILKEKRALDLQRTQQASTKLSVVMCRKKRPVKTAGADPAETHKP